ncbi:MAG: M56 family metallopeptidase, partial [Pseudomonadales bacterium]
TVPVLVLLLSQIWDVQVRLIEAVVVPGTFLASVNQIVSGSPDWVFVATGTMVGSATVGICLLARDIKRLQMLVKSTSLVKQRARLLVRIGNKDQAPCSFSILGKTTIILPAELDQTSLNCVFSHEAWHVRAHDTTWNWAVAILRLLYALNPAFIDWLRQYDRACEVACDQHVLKNKNLSVRAYCLTLLEIASRRVSGGSPPSICVNFISSKQAGTNEIKQRVKALALHREKAVSRWRHLLPVIALLISICVTSTDVSLRSWSLSSLADETNQNLFRFSEQPLSRPYGLVLAF